MTNLTLLKKTNKKNSSFKNLLNSKLQEWRKSVISECHPFQGYGTKPVWHIRAQGPVWGHRKYPFSTILLEVLKSHIFCCSGHFSWQIYPFAHSLLTCLSWWGSVKSKKRKKENSIKLNLSLSFKLKSACDFVEHTVSSTQSSRKTSWKLNLNCYLCSHDYLWKKKLNVFILCIAWP